MSSLVAESVVVITGFASAFVKIVIDKASDSEIFPAASVAVTVNE